MKAKLYLNILWSLLSIGLLNFAVDTHEFPFTGPKRIFKLIGPKSKPIKLSTRGYKEPYRIPSSTSSLSPLNTPLALVTPRAVDFAYLPDVSLTCSTSDFVVRVKPIFYGLGAEAEELKIGNTCKSNGVLTPYGDLLFTYPLTACDSILQSPRGYLVYKFVLHYEPSSKRFPSRAQRIDVDIECRYPRNHHVYQLIVQPTWKTAVVRKRLKGGLGDFQIDLMDDSWTSPAQSHVYQLGNKINFQVSALHLSPGGRLYINNCYATPSFGSKQSHKYIIIDNFGCMLDSKRDPGASQFISRTDKTLRFSLKAFQFTSDPEMEVNIYCKLFVESKVPGPAHKSCTYRGKSWKALTGDDSICGCCDSQCVTSKPRRAMMEGSVSSGLLLVSDQPYMAEDGFLPINPNSVNRSGDGKATIIHYIDELHSYDNVQGSEDGIMYDDDSDVGEEEPDEVESSFVPRVRTEPDLKEFGLGERDLVEEKNKSTMTDPSPLEENGSGYLVQEDFSEGEEGFEGRKNKISDLQQEVTLIQREVLELMLPSEVTLQKELQSLISEEEESRKHTVESEEDGRLMASEVKWKNEDLVDEATTTWYFWG